MIAPFVGETLSLRRDKRELDDTLRKTKGELEKQANYADTITANKMEISNLSDEVAVLKANFRVAYQNSRKADEENNQILAEITAQRQEERDQHATEVAELKQLMNNMTLKYEAELRKKNELYASAENKHETTIQRLEEELQKTQGEHSDYLAKLMDVLDNTNAAREAKMQQMKYDYEAKLNDRDERYKRLHASIVMESEQPKKQERLGGVSFFQQTNII